MDRITVHVGTECSTRSGMPVDRMRPVEFEGEKLAQVNDFHGGSDTRGVTETLYETADGRYVVYVENWTKWQGETSTYELVEAAMEDFEPGGRFEMLGREADLSRPLTLDEALTDREDSFEF